ncbi:MAG TPA: efflux RND transporter periplasmic adaptor subunit [Steroidobacteraceae bacterium]|nr:efflux RND transporter periplasmic adaptor subunit [Steroidobacteraceae bacterium]
MRTLQSTGLAIALAGAFSLLAACGAKPPAARRAPAPPLASVVVRSESVPRERFVDGTVEAVNQATLSAQTSGRVAAIFYDVGDVVPAGAVLMRLQGTEQRAGLQAAQAGLAEARARDAEAAAAYRRIAGMFQRHVVSKAQFDQASANRAAAAARMQSALAGRAAAREGVGYTEIRAPYAGVIGKRLVEVGEAVRPGTPLMSGLSLQNLRVDTHVPQSVVMQVRRLKRAAVYVGNRRIEATRITIFPEAAATSSTFKAHLDLPSGAFGLAPGMYVKVALVIGTADRLLIPASALVVRSEVTGVYVIGVDGQVSLRYVRAGRRFGARIEILAGLAPGERIALDVIAAGARVAAAESAP